MADIEVAFAAAPVGARRRRLPPVLIGLAIVALLALAVAKPWGGADPGSSPDASTGAAIAAASASSAPAGSPDATGEPEATGALTPGGIKGPPRLGAWGISVGTAILGSSTFEWANWSEWVPLEPVSDGPLPSIRDPQPIGTDCTSVPTLAGAPTVLGITVPQAMSTDFSVLGWFSAGPWEATLDEELSRIDSPGRSQFAALARRDGLAFPDGRYELHLLTPDRVTALGFCIDSGAASRPADGAVDEAITAQIVRDLAGRSGAWGVGDGGNGPRLVRDEPWTDWVAVEPLIDGSGIAVWPDTGICNATPILLSNPALVAITVPPGLPPDWRVAAWWSDGPNIARLDGVVRQISPPGNRGITYLERTDRSTWPDGRYEFQVRAGRHVTSLTVCIGSP